MAERWVRQTSSLEMIVIPRVQKNQGDKGGVLTWGSEKGKKEEEMILPMGDGCGQCSLLAEQWLWDQQ